MDGRSRARRRGVPGSGTPAAVLLRLPDRPVAGDRPDLTPTAARGRVARVVPRALENEEEAARTGFAGSRGLPGRRRDPYGSASSATGADVGSAEPPAGSTVTPTPEAPSRPPRRSTACVVRVGFIRPADRMDP